METICQQAVLPLYIMHTLHIDMWVCHEHVPVATPFSFQGKGMKNQVAYPWQVWICLLPFHSKSVSRLTKLTNQCRAESVTSQTRSEMDSSGLGTLHQTCLTLSGSVKSPAWHGLDQIYQTKQMHRFRSSTLNLYRYWGTAVCPCCSCVCPNGGADFVVSSFISPFLPCPSQAHSWNTVL